MEFVHFVSLKAPSMLRPFMHSLHKVKAKWGVISS